MKIAITGAEGRMGRVLREHWRGRHELIEIGNETDLRVGGDWQRRIGEAETVVHLAADLNRTHDLAALQHNISMTLNVVGAAEHAARLVFASSIWAIHEQTGLGPRGDYYTAAKRTGEAILRGWSDIHARPSVSLRLGHFGSAVGTMPIEHEFLRIDESTLRWWFDKAIAFDEPAAVAWQVIGLSNHLKATGAR